MTDVVSSMMNAPGQLWVAIAVFLASLGLLEFLVVKLLLSLSRAQRRTLAKIALVVLFFPLIFLFLMCSADPDD